MYPLFNENGAQTTKTTVGLREKFISQTLIYLRDSGTGKKIVNKENKTKEEERNSYSDLFRNNEKELTLFILQNMIS